MRTHTGTDTSHTFLDVLQRKVNGRSNYAGKSFPDVTDNVILERAAKGFSGQCSSGRGSACTEVANDL